MFAEFVWLGLSKSLTKYSFVVKTKWKLITSSVEYVKYAKRNRNQSPRTLTNGSPLFSTVDYLIKQTFANVYCKLLYNQQKVHIIIMIYHKFVYTNIDVTEACLICDAALKP